MKFPALLLLTAATALASTSQVSTSLRHAVEHAHPGDTLIVLGPTVFHERLIINKTLTLIGTNSPVIDADAYGTPLIIAAPGVVIRNLKLQNSGRDLTQLNAGIMISSSNAIVSNCQLNNDGFGIYLRRASHCFIASNSISGSPQLASAQRGNGIHLWNTEENRLLHNSIHDKRDGIYLSYAHHSTVAENDVRNTRFGIHYMYSHQNLLENNRLSSNTVGATLMFARDCALRGNLASHNRRHGILLKQFENALISGNIVSGQNRGFVVQQCVKTRFEKNVISGNDIGLYLSNCSEDNVFTQNAFLHNVDQVWQPPDEVAQGRLASNRFFDNGRGNFWSDYTGTDLTGDGIGDTPYHEADTFGYIVDRHPEAQALLASPAAALLRKGEELLPILDTPGVTDPYPLVRWPWPAPANSVPSAALASHSAK